MELNKYRRIARLTQQELADQAGVDHTLIWRLENGERNGLLCRFATVVRLARALNLTPEELQPVPDYRPGEPTDADAPTEPPL